MGKLHDELEDSGFVGHSLEVFLVRILFSLFADDSGIFEQDSFKDLADRFLKTSTENKKKYSFQKDLEQQRRKKGVNIFNENFLSKFTQVTTNINSQTKAQKT